MSVSFVFHRFFKCQSLDPGNLLSVKMTVLDRLRIPWFGGAVRVSPAVCMSFVSVPSIILLGSISLVASLVTYGIVLPVFLFSATRKIMDSNRAIIKANLLQYKKGLSKTMSLRSLFYPSFLISSLCWILFFSQTSLFPHKEISLLEGFVAHALGGLSVWLLVMTHVRSSQGFEPPTASEEDFIESGVVWRLCGECRKQVPAQASHCRTCDTCYLLRDHHCLW